MSRSKLWLIFLPVALALALTAVAPLMTGYAQGALPTRYTLPGDQVFPEGIAYQPATGSFYVSSTTDGTIFQGSLQQEAASVFLPGGADGRTTAIGLKVDDGRRLYVAGGNTGQMFVYDTTNRQLIAKFSHGKSPTFVNDVAVARNGEAYFTDSMDPTLYRAVADGRGNFTFEPWLNFDGTPLVYTQGFNLNGIAASENGRYLIVIQSNTGKLFRISTADKEVREIDLGGQTLTSGDGIFLRGNTLYVCRNQLEEIAVVQMSSDLLSGTVVSTFTDPSFAFPTTIAVVGDRLLAVNSQFDKRQSGAPELPFTVSSVPLPAGVAPGQVGMPRTGGGDISFYLAVIFGAWLLGITGIFLVSRDRPRQARSR